MALFGEAKPKCLRLGVTFQLDSCSEPNTLIRQNVAGRSNTFCKVTKVVLICFWHPVASMWLIHVDLELNNPPPLPRSQLLFCFRPDPLLTRGRGRSVPSRPQALTYTKEGGGGGL